MMKAFVESQERSEERPLKFDELRAEEDKADEERLLNLLEASQKPSHVPQHQCIFYGGQYNNFEMNRSIVTINKHALFLWSRPTNS